MAKRYDVIVVDPPWPTGKTGKRSSRPNQTESLDYPTMSIDEIQLLPIANMAKPTSILFLWTIQKFLPISFNMVERWGYRYRLTLSWDKSNGIVLGGFHYRTEFVVVGVRGNWPTFLRQHAMPSIFSAKSPSHSVKPDIFYDYAEVFGDNCIDLFARELRLGWDAWGNEVPCDIDMKDYRNG